MPSDDQLTSVTILGVGTTAQAALQALLDQLPLDDGEIASGEERATVIRAAAPTVETLIPRLLDAAHAAEDDLELVATALTLGGLMKTDEGWRAWATLTGAETTGLAPEQPWMPGLATMERKHGVVTIRLTLRQERSDG